MFFNRNKNRTIKLAECSFMRISTGSVMDYFDYLRNEFKIFDLEYNFENRYGEPRCIIMSGRYNKKAISYFNDRCPAMIESEIRACIKHSDFKHYEVAYPIIIMLPIADEGIIDYPLVLDGKTPTKVKFADGVRPYDSLPYVYKFVLSLPRNTSLPLELNKYGIKKFFIKSFSSNFDDLIIEDEITVDNVKNVLISNCVEFTLKVDPSSTLNEFLQKIDVDDCMSQLNNELNIKLKKYLNFPSV